MKLFISTMPSCLVLTRVEVIQQIIISLPSQALLCLSNWKIASLYSSLSEFWLSFCTIVRLNWMSRMSQLTSVWWWYNFNIFQLFLRWNKRISSLSFNQRAQSAPQPHSNEQIIFSFVVSHKTAHKIEDYSQTMTMISPPISSLKPKTPFYSAVHFPRSTRIFGYIGVMRSEREGENERRK